MEKLISFNADSGIFFHKGEPVAWNFEQAAVMDLARPHSDNPADGYHLAPNVVFYDDEVPEPEPTRWQKFWKWMWTPLWRPKS